MDSKRKSNLYAGFGKKFPRNALAALSIVKTTYV